MNFFYTYVLKSSDAKPVTYVGYTKNLKNRLKLHNNGKGARFTRGRKWKVIYKEKFRSKRMAILRELYIKKKIGKNLKFAIVSL